METTVSDPQQPEDENRLIAERRTKLAALRDQGPAFPNDFRRTALAGELQRDFEQQDKAELEEANQHFSVAGRLIRNRGAFLLIQDGSGTIQLYLNRQGLSEEAITAIKTWDLGDIVAASGPLHRSGKGDLCARCQINIMAWWIRRRVIGSVTLI
jgi:lysyl-tRNA synthetase class 2